MTVCCFFEERTPQFRTDLFTSKTFKALGKCVADQLKVAHSLKATAPAYLWYRTRKTSSELPSSFMISILCHKAVEKVKLFARWRWHPRYPGYR